MDDDTDEVDGFDDFQERVCDDRTGEVLDAKDEVLGKDGRSSHEHQMGSREPRYVVQPHREGQACREGFQNERKGIYVCSHAAIGGQGIVVPHVRQGAARLSRRQMAKAEVDVH